MPKRVLKALQPEQGELFIGRQEELAKLTALIDPDTGQSGSLMLVTGEPGVGKSRLLSIFAGIASERGVAVLSGVCEEQWTPPFRPFVDALCAHFRAANDKQLKADLADGASPLARLIPEIRERLPETPEPATLSPDEERFRLLDAVARYLLALEGIAY